MSSSFRRGPRGSTTTTSAANEGISSQSSRFLGIERPGTKPWIGGLSLTSSGLRDLDVILGGGQPLGTAILIEEDRWTQDLAFALVRYWAAEALAQNQSLALITTLPELQVLESIDNLQADVLNFQEGMNKRSFEAFLSTLPRNLHLDKDRSKEDAISKAIIQKSSRQQEFEGFGTIQEVDDEDFEEEADELIGEDEGLSNAWQYKLSIQRERQGATITKSTNETKTFCHSYDLSGRMEEQYPSDWFFMGGRTHFLDCRCQWCPNFSCKGTTSCANHLYKKCVNGIQDILKLNPNTVVRLLVMNAPVKILAVAFPMIQHYIRSNSLPVVMMLTVRPWLQTLSEHNVGSISSKQAIVSLRRNCDAVLTCEGFGAMASPPPPEFSDLAGILTIRKIALQSLTHFADSTTNRRPPANRYGMKRDRRKMHIRMLHLPPEDFSAGGSSVGSGARSGAGRSSDNSISNISGNKTALQPGMGCSSNLRSSSEAAKSLEF